MGLDTSKLKASLDKAKTQVGGFAKTASAKLDGLRKSFSGINGILTGAVVGGFMAAAKSAMSYAKEMTTLSQISSTSIEDFQGLAFGAKKYGIEQEKLADIFKDTNDKLGDFIQTGGGPLVDFFDNIGKKIGITADHFKGLSGPEALQLYYNSLEKANLSSQDMTFYMEAIASDATALIPLLENGGKAWKGFADEAERAGLILDTKTAEELRKAQLELEKLGNVTVITAGKITAKLAGFKGLRHYFGLAPNQQQLIDKTYGHLVQKTSSMSDLILSLGDLGIAKVEAETEAHRKSIKEREALQTKLGALDKKISSEREKRLGLEQTATEALAAAEKKRLDAAVALQVAASSGDELKAKKAQLVYAEALTDEAKARKTVKDGVVKQDKEIAGLLKKGSEISAEIAKQVAEESKERELVAEQVKLQGDLKDAIARGDLEAVKTNEKALEIEEQILQVIRDHNVTRPEAVAHVKNLMAEEQQLIDEKENAAAKEEAQKQKMIDLQRQLFDAQASGNDGLAREIQNRINKEQMALDLMNKLGISIDEAREKAEKLAAVNAGPDLNQSGIVTRQEQKEFDRRQKVKAKELEEARRAEEREQRARGGNIRNVSEERRKTGTVRERAAAAKEERERNRANRRINRERDPERRAALIKAEDERRAKMAQPKVGAPPLGPDGKPVDANGQPLPEGGGGDPNAPGGVGGPNAPVGGGGGGGPKEPKKPEQVIADELGGKLDKQIALLGDIKAALKC